MLNFLKTVPLAPGGFKPPPQPKLWGESTPTVAVESSQDVADVNRHPGGSKPPPFTENQHVTTSDTAVDIDISITIFDRVLKAKPSKINAELLTTARDWLHGYMCKLGREKDAHPPDNTITAQFLAVAEWPKLERLLYDLLAERKQPGYSYAWFVTVALQRIYGITPAQLKQRRAELKLVRPAKQYHPSTEQDPQPDPEFATGLINQLATKRWRA